ncbi:MAG: caspase family protein [Pirellulaceae bacterium]|nr:caspase family protein [Pirellulaceae bacterium]
MRGVGCYGFLLLVPAVVAWNAVSSFAQEQRVDLAVQTGHTRSVVAVALSADGRVAITGSEDHTAILWDTATGLTLKPLRGHRDHVRTVALSGDGKLALTGSRDETAVLWNSLTGESLHTFKLASTGNGCAALSVDGKRLFTPSADREGTLWNAQTGEQLRTIPLAEAGAAEADLQVHAAEFSADGRRLVVAVGTSATLWDAASGEKLLQVQGTPHKVTGGLPHLHAVAISGDGQQIATADDTEVIVWDVSRKARLRSLTGFIRVREVALRADGRRVFIGATDDGTQVRSKPSENRVVEVEVETGRQIRELLGVGGGLTAIALDGAGSRVIAGSTSDRAVVWNIVTGKQEQVLTGNSLWRSMVAFSDDGRRILTLGALDAIAVWNTTTGRKIWTLKGHADAVIGAALSGDGQRAASISRDHTIPIWDVKTGNKLRTLRHDDDWLRSVALNRDGSRLVAGTHDHRAIIWNTDTGEKLQTFAGHEWPVTAALFSADGARVVTSSSMQTAIVWEAATGRPIHVFPQTPFMVEGALALSGDGKRMASAMDDKTIAVWDAATGALLKKLAGHADWSQAMSMNHDGSRVLSASDDKTAVLWDVATGEKLHTFVGHSHWVRSVALSASGKRVLTGSDDGTIRLWDATTGRELCQLHAFPDESWAVVDSEGRFDAAAGGDVQGLHWVAGLEPIGLKQLKQRYYEPGLLAKAMGFNPEPLRPVSLLKTVQLFPAARLAPLKNDETKLHLELTNRGGGIGRVQVLIDGKELTADARGPAVNAGASSASVRIDLAAAALVPGAENRVSVVVWNAEGYLASRGLDLVLTKRAAAEAQPPELYAIVGGTSDYASPALQLRFAAKDAADTASALELGAKRLFGVARVHVTLLTSDQPAERRPTKANFAAAFAAARRARPGDVLVVYLAGHGISLARGEDLYCYLTEEAQATGSAAFADPAVLAQSAITSEELVEWIKQIPARKQVMLLDTCAAGAAAARLMEHRDLTGDQIRALDRLKDRTGFHVLMGCAADRVSYEASQYSQGLLTYSLLQGMRGAALRDGEFIDVSQLFQYAADQVPQLARNIGGIQKPLVMAPRGTSFDVGRLLPADRGAIPLAMVKPLVLRPLLVNPDVGDDDLGLLPLLRRQISAASYASGRGGDSPALVYVDADELPGAIRPAGTYQVAETKVTVRLNLRREGKTEGTLVVAGQTDDLAGLVERIVKELTAAIQKLPPPK